MTLALSPLPPESEDSKALNIQYPKAIDGDAVVLLGPFDGEETWLKYGGQWNIVTVNTRFLVKRIIDNLTGAFSSPTPGSTNYAAYAALAVVAFLALRGLR